MKGFPTDKINFINEEFTTLNVAVRTLENFKGIGENLIICALIFSLCKCETWSSLIHWKSGKKKGYVFPNELIENIKKLRKNWSWYRFKRKIRKIIKNNSKTGLSQKI